MMNATVRTQVLSRDDARLLQKLLVAFDERSMAEDQTRAWLSQATNVAIAGWHNDEPAGLLWGYFLPRPDGQDDMLLIYSVDVAAEHRRRGVGRALMDAARALRRGGVWLLTAESNEAAMALYRRAGGRRRHDDDVMFEF